VLGHVKPGLTAGVANCAPRPERCQLALVTTYPLRRVIDESEELLPGAGVLFACIRQTYVCGYCRNSRIAIARLAVGGARTPLLSFVPCERLGRSDPDRCSLCKAVDLCHSATRHGRAGRSERDNSHSPLVFSLTLS
jgi:hypothetical protein